MSTKAANFGATPTQVKYAIARAGYECPVYRVNQSGYGNTYGGDWDGNTSNDSDLLNNDVLNNTPSEETWHEVGSTLAARSYVSPNEESESGGSPNDEDTPRITVPKDSMVIEEDVIELDGTQYRLDTGTDRLRLKVFTAKEVEIDGI